MNGSNLLRFVCSGSLRLKGREGPFLSSCQVQSKSVHPLHHNRVIDFCYCIMQISFQAELLFASKRRKTDW